MADGCHSEERQTDVIPKGTRDPGNESPGRKDLTNTMMREKTE